jgi:hypothetical protein
MSPIEPSQSRRCRTMTHLQAAVQAGEDRRPSRVAFPAPRSRKCPAGCDAERWCYLTSESILNIGRYIEITIVPTMIPTPIIMIGSMIEVSEAMLVSTSSS